jgi:hypothetical protein
MCKTKGHVLIINSVRYIERTLPLCRTRWFKVADASMTSKSDEGALKEAKIAVEEVERQRLELEKCGGLVSITSSNIR